MLNSLLKIVKCILIIIYSSVLNYHNRLTIYVLLLMHVWSTDIYYSTYNKLHVSSFVFAYVLTQYCC